MEQAINRKQYFVIKSISEAIKLYELPKDILLKFHCRQIWADLLNSEWESARQLLHQYPLTLLTKENAPLFILYGCWLAATENNEITAAHFSGILDISYPRTWNLLSYFLNRKISIEGKWSESAFMWEKRQLFRQLQLYYHCTANSELQNHFHFLEKQEYVKSSSS